MRQQRQGNLAARLGHFTEAVYVISLCPGTMWQAGTPINPTKWYLKCYMTCEEIYGFRVVEISLRSSFYIPLLSYSNVFNGMMVRCEPYNPNKRGGGAVPKLKNRFLFFHICHGVLVFPQVLGVNLVQKVPDPLERTSRPLLNHAADVEVTTYPREEWRRHYAPLVQANSPRFMAFMAMTHVGPSPCLQLQQVLKQARVINAVEHYLGGPVEPAEAPNFCADPKKTHCLVVILITN